MDKVKDCLAVACLAYGRGETETAIRAFLQGMEACGQEGLNQVVQFLRPPVAAINSDVPAAENTLAPSLHSVSPIGEPVGVNPLDVAKPVDPQPVISPIPEPVRSTLASISSKLLDDGDEELEVRAEAEDDIDEDEEDLEDEEESEESEEDKEESFQLSISSATPVKLKRQK